MPTFPRSSIVRPRGPRLSPATFRSKKQLYLQNGNVVIAGVTRDAAGAILPSCKVLLFTMSNVLVGQQVSDPVTGAFSFTVGGNDLYYEVAMLQGAPDRAGATIDVGQLASTPVTPPSGLDPTTLPLNLYDRASYSGAPWIGTASAGTSGTHNFTSSGFAPSVGGAVNGLTPAQYTIAQGLTDSTPSNQIFTSGGSLASGWFLVNFNTLDTGSFIDGGTWNWDKSGIGGSDITLTFNMTYAAGVKSVNVFPLNSLTWYLLQWRATATQLEFRVNNNAWNTSTFAASTLAPGAGGQAFADPTGGGFSSSGKMLEMAIAKDLALTNVQFDDLRTYVNNRYALSV